MQSNLGINKVSQWGWASNLFLSQISAVLLKSKSDCLWLMRSAYWKPATRHWVKCSINCLSLSVPPETGTTNPLSAVQEQWNSEVVIPLVLVHWAGQRVNGVGVGGRHRPGGCWQRPHSHTLWASNWPTQMDSAEERSGWFSYTGVWAGHNSTVCFPNPLLSVISKFFLTTLKVKRKWWRKV